VEDLENIQEACLKLLFIWDESGLSKVDKFLQKRISEGLPFFVSYSFTKIMEFMCEGAHKGVALSAFSDILNFPLEKIIAMGDNVNDIDFLKRAAYKIAVANAIDELREIADCVVVNNNEHAVADVIGRITRGEIALPKS
jgi:hydroxymethylpyrimidine pyrophosphatase-like HAD family hydrolase